jgi:hypothetical protein
MFVCDFVATQRVVKLAQRSVQPFDVSLRHGVITKLLFSIFVMPGGCILGTHAIRVSYSSIHHRRSDCYH